MPAVSERQRRLMAIALSIKRGETPRSYSREAARIADSMSEAELRKYAKRTKRRSKKRSKRKNKRASRR